MRRRLLALLTASLATAAFAASCPNGAALLKNNTPLADLCPKGFGQFNPGSISQAMQAQPNNVAMVVAAAEQAGVPTNLALAVSYHESEGFNSCAGSDTGVKGPMQLTQRTARTLGYNRDINEQNIKGGMAVLKQVVDACGASNYTCLSARYNGSPRPGEQAGWARGVQRADAQVQNNPSLLAQACTTPANKGGTDCPSGGATPNGVIPPTPGNAPVQLPPNLA